MSNISSSSFCRLLQKCEVAGDAETMEEVVAAKCEAIRSDPFAMELALRLAVADTSYALGQSFRSCYKLCSEQPDAIGDLWIALTTVCLEDKVFGKGRPGTIMNHPMLDAYPMLRDLDKGRGDFFTRTLAKRFQAAFETMNAFDKKHSRSRGISSFDSHLGNIEEPDDLWVVLAGLDRLVPKSPLARCS